MLATNFLLDPIVGFLDVILHSLTQVTHNFGWSLIVLAVLVKLVFWPLNSFQFKSIAKMQALQPQLRALQAKHKGDPQKLQQETDGALQDAERQPVRELSAAALADADPVEHLLRDLAKLRSVLEQHVDVGRLAARALGAGHRPHQGFVHARS